MTIKSSGRKMSPSRKGNIFISLWNVHQMSGRNVCPPGWLMQAVVDPLVPLPVIWKRSPIKNWPLLWHVHDTIRQRQRTIGIFSKWGRQSYRENKAILSLYQNILNTILFITLLVPFPCLICHIQSLIALFPKFQLVMYQLHDLCHI